jgi:hypothetical protein
MILREHGHYELSIVITTIFLGLLAIFLAREKLIAP